jgi:protocatechuate 3,4-dioxygenase alpha subunit
MSGRTTPSQTVGPFYGIGFSWLERTDLTDGAEDGTRVSVSGRVLDGDDKPVPDAVIEIWQADADGRYTHPEDAFERVGRESFFGFGRVPVNEAGEFRFATVKPGCVPGPNATTQAPHLVISIFMRGLLRRLVTRMYFPGKAANETDAVLGLVPVERRHTLVARPDGGDERSLRWDIHLQGDSETVFFEC